MPAGADFEILAKHHRTFCSDYCGHQWRLRTDIPGYVRDQVFYHDRGHYAVCRTDTVAIYTALKHAGWFGEGPGAVAIQYEDCSQPQEPVGTPDHILPVCEGGGQCNLDSIRTLLPALPS